MTGDLYLLNALWAGAALFAIGKALPFILHTLRVVFVMCLPFGLVALWHYARDVHKAAQALRDSDDNET